MKLYLVRHAPVPAAAGLCYGRIDLPADPAATRAAAVRLAAELPQGIALHTSPLQRCHRLAAELAALRPDVPAPRTDPRLAEMDFGVWEGQPWNAIGQTAVDAWLADFAHHAPGGGESVQQFMARVAAAWQDWRASTADALWITHAGVLRAVELLRQGCASPRQASEWPQVEAPHGVLQVVHC